MRATPAAAVRGEQAHQAGGKHVQVREQQDGTVRIFFDGVQLTARPFPKDDRVRQADIVRHKLLGDTLRVIQREQQACDQRALEQRRLTQRERTQLQHAMSDAWAETIEAVTP